MEVADGGFNRGMSEQGLHISDVSAILKEVGGKGMSKGMDGSPFAYTRFFFGVYEDHSCGSVTQMFFRFWPRKKPISLGLRLFVILSKQGMIEQAEYGIPVLFILALIDPDAHTIRVNIALF